MGENKKYFIMTSEQKEMLEHILEALNINIEDFLLVGNMRMYDETMRNFEARLNNYENNLIQLNNRIADLEQEKAEKNTTSILEELAQNGDY